MARVTLYSSSRRPAITTRSVGLGGSARFAKRDADGERAPAPAEIPPSNSRLSKFYRRYERLTLAAAGAAFALLAVFLYLQSEPTAKKLTQRDIDLAVLHTLETKPIPSRPAAAYQIIRPSIVRVRQLEPDKKPAKDDKAKTDQPKDGTVKSDDKGETEDAVGTGVVIEDTGKILTALHVVAGAHHVGVIFADGTESDAEVIGAQPENDIAVLQAKTLPDDLQPATLRPSLKGLRSGDEVMAVGFPFGVGPSLSAGVISGFGREYVGKSGHPLTNLIQFDTAANPGNSGGPLITDDGEVIGIVTAILNPTDQAFFIGIGFAVPIENAASGVGISPF